MILEFIQFCKDEAILTGKYPSYTRHSWIDFICGWEDCHPTVIHKSKSGNGTNTQIYGYHFKATSNFVLQIYSANQNHRLGIDIRYSQLKKIELTADAIIINDIMALKKLG